MRILVAEDDSLIGDGLNIGLCKLGFTVDWFQDGNDVYEALFQAPYDAVVLDLGLPGKDGLSILRDWRLQKRKEPVLILTARGDVDQRVIGLESGADDYLSKPFALAEVAARLKALIRRSSDRLESVIIHGDIVFYPETKKILRNNEAVVLAPKELKLLELFFMNPKKVFAKEMLEEKLYSWDDEIQSNAVEVHVHHIRKKLGKSIIKTINKIGYMLGEYEET
jgi:two-component system response regulator QseB